MILSSRSSGKPTVVFVPGAFHTPVHFEPISTLLQATGFHSIAVSRPSIGEQAATSNYRDDVRAVRETLERLVQDECQDVILAPHSAGAVSGCQAVNGLEKSKRRKEGKGGGVIHVLFIAGLLLKQGQTLQDALGGGLPSWVQFDGHFLRPGNVSPVFYSDLLHEEAEHWSALLRHQSAGPTAADVATVCYEIDVPITCVLCTEDPAFHMHKEMVEKNKTAKWRIVEIGGGHSPFLGRKKELLAAIEGCADARI